VNVDTRMVCDFRPRVESLRTTKVQPLMCDLASVEDDTAQEYS
jgi:hypothetical protein